MIERKNSPYAVVNVDIENDFLPGGSLAVNGGNEIIPAVNDVEEVAYRSGILRAFGRDLHPAKTTHFDTWPPHCVQGTKGAEYPDELVIQPGAIQVGKGMGVDEDAYSEFQGLTEDGRTLDEVLKEHRVEELFVTGLATDYCVKETVLDALRLGYRVNVLEDTVRAVNLQPDDGDKAWKEMTNAGAVRMHSSMAIKKILAVDAHKAGSVMGREWRKTHMITGGNA